jgi:hypothetical protein
VEGSSYAHDFEETKGVDFQETFAPTMKWPTIKNDFRSCASKMRNMAF